MNKKLTLTTLTSILAISPMLAFAQVATGGHPGTIATNFSILGEKIVTQLWIVFTVIAIIAFVIAGILFLASGGDPEKVTKARQAFIWGVAGVAAAIIAYSIVAIVLGGLGG